MNILDVNTNIPIPIEYKVSRNEWFTFISIRKEYNKLIEKWKQYFYIQMINQFSNIEYQNGWAFHATNIGFEKVIGKLKFTWFLKEYETATYSSIGFQCVIEKDFQFKITRIKDESVVKLLNTEAYNELKFFFGKEKLSLFCLSQLDGITESEMLLWDIGNNPILISKIYNKVKAITESNEFTELFINLNKAKHKELIS
jgi:hypothetical protein